jgi:DNA-binding transcriptional LysR family regulator
MHAVHYRDSMDAYPSDLLVHLRSFLVLQRRIESAAAGAFENASLDLHLDTSVLRRRMQALARWAEGAILEGRGRTLRLTLHGRRLAATAERILRELQSLHAPPRPRVAIGCTGTITNELLPAALVAARRRFGPTLEVIIRRAGAELARELLARGEVDLAVIRSTGAPAGLRSRWLMRDRLWLAIPRGHPLERAARVTLRELGPQPLISFRPGSFTRQRVEAALGPHGATIAMEVDGKPAALRYVKLGMGICFLSVVTKEAPEAPGVVLREVTSLFRPASFWIVWPRQVELNDAQQLIVEQLLAQAR